ncbi:MAG: type II secretion system protein [Candidatus Omnitrophica bacterium]|nr:type II secretion system protein [Candidatus Omnitrophota bacterium]
MNKISRNSIGFTLVELLLAVLILGFTLVGLLQVFIRCSVFAEIAQSKSAVMSLLQGRMEDIRQRDYADIVALYDATASGDPAETFDLDPLTGKAAVYITQFNAGDDNLMQIKIVGSWKAQQDRIMGEDLDLDGVEDTGEDVDGDGDFSSMAMVISCIAARY